MTRVGEALRRKLGPLPVWAWALLGGIAIYFWRQRSSGGGASSVPAAVSPDVTDQTQVPQGQVLQPGETYVPPGYGSPLTGGASDQATGPDATSPGADTSAGDADAGGASAPTPSSSRRSPKPKAHKAKPAAKGRPHRARSAATLLGGVAKQTAKRAVPKGRPRSSAKKTAAPERGRSTPPARVALRQRPAAPNVVHSGTQQVAPHPAAPAPAAKRIVATAPKPAAHPKRKR